RITQSIRDLCIFARQDVTRDPPFSRLDLVSCRNLLIYLDAAAQARVMQVFHYSLRPHGFLLLGPSESVGHAADLFELADKPHRLFTRRTGAPGATLAAPRGSAPHRGSRDSEIGDRMLGDADSPLREADRILLARYAPASLLVDDQLNVLQFRGETGPYLEQASGPPSTALHRIVRPELLAEVAPAIQEARETGNEVRREGLRLEDAREVAIQVIALQSLNSERGFLILFDDGSRRRNDRRARQSPAKVLTESEKDRRLAQLEREAVAIRDYLQATMEAHEAVKEELKSAHEEVLSANEEFQSTNEELETSKEELQSTNEELVTTNEELRNRNRELAALNEELRGARARSEMARHYAEAIVETVREPLVVLDTDLKILRANRAFYAEFDVSRDETENRFLYEVGNGQWNVPALRERLHSVITDRVPLANFDVTAVFPSIGRRLMSLNARRVAGDGERSDVILLAIDDITEQKAANDHLREINRRKDEFLAMLAHELRNPLAPISYAMQLLRRSEVEPAVARMYDMIERQTGRLKRLVDELLDVARISRGVIELKRQVVDLIDIAQAAGEACRPRLLERRHQLKLVLPDAPVLVDGDPVRLEQVVSNLLENAIKYTNPGGQIVLALAQQGRSACIRVRDNGIGLAPEMLDHVFDLFTQVDTSLSHAGGGLGLGLTVVRRVLELHGGGIEARSDGLGKGSEFIVTVPVITDAALLESATRRPPQRVDGGRRRRVLIVDDNEDAAESMALLAGAWGHQVAVAHDGPAALELAKTFHPQIAIVDIGLPGMDGYEVARRLRKENDPSALRLMAMTGYGRTQDREAAIAAGFAFHLVKPADVDQLQELLAGD
ncbi:MAG TPA: ATP-binding protein, partial [Steroidobacteraceae bacterium]|nr:ATP-binding protein [Steroidobacteraceae bacterium]